MANRVLIKIDNKLALIIDIYKYMSIVHNLRETCFSTYNLLFIALRDGITESSIYFDDQKLLFIVYVTLKNVNGATHWQAGTITLLKISLSGRIVKILILFSCIILHIMLRV